MCGILGTLPRTDQSLFKFALDTLTHRGPDSYGIENINDEVSMGHRRLSILDLTQNGHQPMQDEDKRYTVVLNGEIYNFLELKEILQKKGYSFKSSSDTEVLLKSYIEWGEDCVMKFNGMWAFAIWDNQKKELFLSRDRYGKKPLFYAQIEGKFIFASEMKAIYPFIKNLEISEDFHWMKNNIFRYETTDKCLVKGIKRFPHGHNGVFSNNKLSVNRYWNTLDHLVEVPKSYDEQVEQFRHLFLDACKLRMRSDVAIGTALSGGLDSSATIAAMSHLSKNNKSYSNDWQHAFVATFPGTPMDESKYARMVTDHLGINGTFMKVDPLKHWGKLEEYFYLFEDLYITTPIPMIMIYEAVKTSGVTVTLDGHGADELFSGYNELTEALWDSKLNLSSIKDILNTYSDTLNTSSQFDQINYFKYYSKYMVKTAAKKLLGKDRISRDHNHPNFKKLDNLSKHLYVIFNETILPTLLRNYDRYAMISGVEIRMPFMDHRLVSFVNSLPYTSKIGGGYTKKLIRDAIDPYLPKDVTWRKSKIGFTSPIVDWMQNDLNEWFSDTVNSQSFLESSLLDNPLQLQKNIMNIVTKKSSNFVNAQDSWRDLTPYIWGKSVLDKNHKLV